MTQVPPTPRSKRPLFALAALGAAAVTAVFATVGDGVEVPDASGLRALVVDAGHTAVWALLALAFAIAAVRGRWTRVSNGIAIAAGILYLVFLVAVFVWP
jgi:hypothetical protein